MATTRKPRQAKVEVEVDEDEELEEELDELDELEALADEDDEPEVVEEDEDEDAPRRKRTKSEVKKKNRDTIINETKAYGTSALAKDLETDGKNLRVLLRDLKANRPRKKGTTGSFNESGRYEWEDLQDALETLKFDSVEDAIDRLKDSRNTRLEALKERNAESKKKKASAKAAPVEEDLEDEEDEDEDEEPTPKSRRRRK